MAADRHPFCGSHCEPLELEELLEGDIAMILDHIDRGDTLFLGDLLTTSGNSWAAPYWT